MEGRRVFPFRDFLVPRTYEPRADATAILVADALAEAVGEVAVLRVEDDALDRAARHAALAVVVTPVRRRPPGAAGGDPSQLAARLGLPVVVVPPGLGLTSPRSIVCGVREVADTPSVIAAAALADALDLQLILAHVASDSSNHAAARELLGDVARRARRTAPGASCPRLARGLAAEELCRIGSDERALLITVTASGAGRFSSAVRGSVTRDLVRQADRPVFVWPRQPSPALAPDSILSAQRSRTG